MKLLFDENLSPKLGRLLDDLFPNSVHVRDIGLKAANDPQVWDYAKSNGLIIVSKDADMHQRSFMFGAPPKLVWVRLGNCSTSKWKNCYDDTLKRSKHSMKTSTHHF